MIATGVNDPLFPGASMKPPADMSEIEFHPIDSGHFALEDHCGEIGALTLGFLDRVFGRAPAHQVTSATFGAVIGGLADRTDLRPSRSRSSLDIRWVIGPR
jgi:hypothetical protein